MIKEGSVEQHAISFELHYFQVKIVQGELTVQDPDELILEVAWKSLDELDALPMTYPDDTELLKKVLKDAANVSN
jgi:aminoglycoside 6'-N-acetyltransferase